MKITWTTHASFVTTVAKNDRSIVVMVQPGPRDSWMVLALQGPAAPKAAEDLLCDHAHKAIGEYPDVPKAFEAAESFVRAWLKGFKSTQHEQCDCEEIPEEEKIK